MSWSLWITRIYCMGAFRRGTMYVFTYCEWPKIREKKRNTFFKKIVNRCILIHKRKKTYIL